VDGVTGEFGGDVVDNDEAVLSEKSGGAGCLCSSGPMCDLCGLRVSGMDACARRSARLSRVWVCWLVIGLVLGVAFERVSLVQLVDARAEYRVHSNHQNENRRLGSRRGTEERRDAITGSVARIYMWNRNPDLAQPQVPPLKVMLPLEHLPSDQSQKKAPAQCLRRMSLGQSVPILTRVPFYGVV
jgi:hypothetical protein